MNKRLVGVAIACAFASGTVFAAGEQQPQSFSELDTNQDGSLSLDEAAPDEQLVQNWDQADKNQDGVVDQAEFSAFEEEMGGGQIQETPEGGGEPQM